MGVPADRLRRICERLFDEAEFLSPYGIRSLSKVYETAPFCYTEGSESDCLFYSPADSPVAMFGGNSNWRGPVWMPLNYLLIESLQKFGHFYGDSFMVEFPTGSGVWLSLWDVDLFQQNPHWCDLIQFHEYFHGDTGRGVGASHQTGWSAIVCKMINQLSQYPVP